MTGGASEVLVSDMLLNCAAIDYTNSTGLCHVMAVVCVSNMMNPIRHTLESIAHECESLCLMRCNGAHSHLDSM